MGRHVGSAAGPGTPEGAQRGEPAPADRRSVGELLVDADHTVRDLLIDVNGHDAAALLRTWSTVVSAASHLWQALPPTTGPSTVTGDTVPSTADLTMARLHAISHTVTGTAPNKGRRDDFAASRENVRATASRPDDAHNQGQAVEGWPGVGPSDPRLLQIADSFTRAANLLTAGRTPEPPLTERERHDVRAAQAHVMHTLYLGSHAVGTALGHHQTALERMIAGRAKLPPGESLTRTRTARARLSSMEHQAGTVVSATHPHDLSGEHHPTPAPDRLAHALADFDIQAHRTLSARTNTADLMLVGHTHALILAATTTMLRAAAATGHLDGPHAPTTEAPHRQSQLAPGVPRPTPDGPPPRLLKVLGTSQADWMTMTSLWRDLTATSALQPHLDLARASQECRAAIHDSLRDGAAVATPELIATRTDLSRVGPLTQQVLSAGIDLAHLVADVATRTDLVGAARGVHALAVSGPPAQPRQVEASSTGGDGGGRSLRTHEPSPQSAWVTPRDLMTNRSVVLPDHVRKIVASAATDVALSSRTVLDASVAYLSSICAPTSDQTAGLVERRPQSWGRARPDRVPPGPSPSRTLSGCER
ncbi:hypothetical protein [Lapillicoccus sp.]|uniref:hypothetical protein n=1 Tax=Lapillicoccus sp. TaxID=1909287 RepID=UPI0025DB093C|nr:hypothetical protein [Lapillicoccus sp.]